MAVNPDSLRVMSRPEADRERARTVYVVAIDHWCEGWTKPEAVCESRAAALAYIGTQADSHRGGSWQIVELPILTIGQVAEPKPEAA